MTAPGLHRIADDLESDAWLVSSVDTLVEEIAASAERHQAFARYLEERDA